MKQYRSLMAVGACALVLSACGGETATEGKAASPVASLGAVEAVVTEYVGGVYSGDASACELETKSFADAQNEAMGTKDCTERVEAIKVMLADGEPLFDMAGLVVEVSKDGEGAKAAVSHTSEDVAGSYGLVLTGDTWLINSESTGEESTDGEAASDDEALSGGSYTEPREAAEEEAVALAKSFCQVKVGSARADVEKWMGEPSAEGVDDDGQAEVDWFVNQDSYTVWFDDADKVASYSSSTPREDDACEE